jgi:hypothetical protein
MSEHLSMDSIDHAINQAIIALRYCLPNPNLWRGVAASSCANSIESLAHQLQNLQARLSSWAH